MEMTIKELMIPIGEYVTVSTTDTLAQYFQALEADKAAKGGAHCHRDALVMGPGGQVTGKVTMHDVFLALEPTYKSIMESMSDTSVLTPDYLAGIYKDFNLWAKPLPRLCERAAQITVGDIMHKPGAAEFVDEADPVDVGLHRYVMGVHQPLLVRGPDGRVSGVLRFGDVFKRVKDMTLSCSL
ncbi:hypothetical protein [Desulfocurvus sp.]|jgi:hypothetical protein|uniref:hypothetical protein n=1 Tax=Desulfocurvus sp. TaxID=2871698 RepID=UPI0025BB8558|nr:hypothetical protein [Desulfocurvus sp.]MCK9240888.1 hypothetical protein [Desulfocurvus sp.]